MPVFFFFPLSLSIYIYLYIYIILSRRQSYLVYKLASLIDLSLFVFVWRCVLRLIFLIQHTLTIFFFFLNLALNLSPFCSLLCSFTALPPHFRLRVLLFVKHNSPGSSTNKARFRKFCKHLSIYPLFIRCVQEKQFCWRSNLPVLFFRMFWQKQNP